MLFMKTKNKSRLSRLKPPNNFLVHVPKFSVKNAVKSTFKLKKALDNVHRQSEI